MKNRLIDLLLNSTIILAIVSALAYLCEYIYEINFCNYFGIPTDLISISWIRFLQHTPLVIALIIPLVIVIKPKWKYILFGILLVLILFYISWLIGTITSWEIVILLTSSLFIVPILYSMLQTLTYSSSYLLWIWWIIATFIIGFLWIPQRSTEPYLLWIATGLLFLQWIVNLIKVVAWFIVLKKQWAEIKVKGEKIEGFKAKIAWFWEKLKEKLKENYTKKEDSDKVFYRHLLEERRQKKKARKWDKVILVITLILLIPYTYKAFGTGDAMLKKEPFVLTTNQSLIVSGKEYPSLFTNQSLVALRIYGDKAICVAVNNESGNYYLTKTREFVIIPLEDITLTPEEIVPLKPQ